jgi:alkaline phosphatase D
MSQPRNRNRLLRRSFLQQATATALCTGLNGILQAQQAPALITSDRSRPRQSWGNQVGDVAGGRAIVWSRSDRPARLLVEWSREEDFRRATRLRGPLALEAGDFTARVDLSRLPADADVFVRTSFEDVDAGRARSDWSLARFRTPPARPRNIRFLWSGDTAGQGWGINLAIGGMRIYETMRQAQPDFFIHSGDTIYADGPMAEQATDASTGNVWRNAFLEEVPEKRKVAETLREFQRAQLYNRYDRNVQRFSAEVPQIWQWDDHEVTNNWSTGKELSADYMERSIGVLASNAARAFLDYAPLRWHAAPDSGRVYRRVPYGPDLDVFVLDMRSYRGANSYNRQADAGADTSFLGRTQLDWLKRELRASRATWKAIAADMPIGLLVPDGADSQGRARFEAIANGDGPVLGREFEIAELLRFMQRERIANTVWFTADVHYTAAHHYDPARAQFRDFDPFWEFVSGPLHAGAFGPSALDNTFGPRVVFQKYPPLANTSPAGGYQFFGQVDIDALSKEMTVSLKDLDGQTVFTQRLMVRS